MRVVTFSVGVLWFFTMPTKIKLSQNHSHTCASEYLQSVLISLKHWTETVAGMGQRDLDMELCAVSSVK
jgi:hypothetical protein